jgi:CRISPR/Cas system-associated exonuclease Cas4 (RecB family)
VSGTEVFLRMDLAYREEDGRVVIVDWKTGRKEGRFNEVQVAGYALYAAEQGWVGRAEDITTELNYLVLPKSVRRSVTSQKIDEARHFIERSASSMKSLLADPVENVAREQDFARVDRPQVCRRCNFRRLCFPRAAVTVPVLPGSEMRPRAAADIERTPLAVTAAAGQEPAAAAS